MSQAEPKQLEQMQSAVHRPFSIGAAAPGLSLLEEGDNKANFHWRHRRAVDRSLERWNASQLGPCGAVLDRNAAMVCSHPELDFLIRPVLEEGLLIPFHIRGEAAGTIWVVAHDTTRRFDAEDLRLMTNLGTFAATAYQTLLCLHATQRLAAIVESSDDAIVGTDFVS